MLSRLFIAFLIMGLCVAIHAMGLMAVFRWMQARVPSGTPTFWAATWQLVCVAGWTVLLHLLQIVVWAAVYSYGGAMANFTSAAYFSAVTYTTTGYGDLVLPEEWRLLGGVEALTGILMCGLSTGLFMGLFTRIFAFRRANAQPA